MEQANLTRPEGSALNEGLGPLLEGWANVEGVRFVSRSYGQYTTSTVSRDSLLDLMKAVQAAERERLLSGVEQRLLTWRQRTMNRSGDHLALDDFMGEDSIADLVDFVCDEWA